MRLLLLFLISCFFYQMGEASEQPIQAIIFDFGNVVATPDRALVCDFLVTSCRTSESQAMEFLENLWEHEKLGGDEKSFMEQYGSHYPWFRFKDKFWRRQWSRAKSISIKEVPGVLEIVIALRKQGFMTPLFSNASCGKEWEESVDKAGYFDYFRPLFLSHQMGVRKPEKGAFELVLKKLELPAEACLLIDDRLENIEAAKEFGMDAIQFKNAEELVKELELRGIHAA